MEPQKLEFASIYPLIFRNTANACCFFKSILQQKNIANIHAVKSIANSFAFLSAGQKKNWNSSRLSILLLLHCSQIPKKIKRYPMRRSETVRFNLLRSILTQQTQTYSLALASRTAGNWLIRLLRPWVTTPFSSILEKDWPLAVSWSYSETSVVQWKKQGRVLHTV